jgi:hypothetical protein
MQIWKTYGLSGKMARKKRSLADEAGKKHTASGGDAALPKKHLTKTEMRARSLKRRMDKKRDASHGLLPDPIGMKKDCRKAVIKNCARTAGFEDKRRVRSYKNKGGIKKCRALIAPAGGHVACQTKTRIKGGVKEKYSTLINKSNKGHGTDKKRKKAKRSTPKGGSKMREALTGDLDDRIAKRTLVPGTNRTWHEEEHKHG